MASYFVHAAHMFLNLGKLSLAAAFCAYLQWRIRRIQRGADPHHHQHHQHHNGHRHRHGNTQQKHHRRWQQIDWQERVEGHFTDFEFKHQYGVSRATFYDIVSKISALIADTPGGWGGVRASEVMRPEVKLCCCCMLARGELHCSWPRAGCLRRPVEPPL